MRLTVATDLILDCSDPLALATSYTP